MIHEKIYAILGDIHGNWEALSAVLKDAADQSVTDYVSVGDVVGYNADPVRCLEAVRELSCRTVRGNHDHYCSYDECLDDFHPLAAKVVTWTRENLTDEQISWLGALRMSMKIDGFSIVHSTLDMPDKWGYVFDTLEAGAHFTYQMTPVCFHGHTHVPAIYEKQMGVRRREAGKIKVIPGIKYFINVGSVGQPRDGDSRACYVLYHARTQVIEFRRLEYDIATASGKIRSAGLPERLAKRLEMGR